MISRRTVLGAGLAVPMLGAYAATAEAEPAKGREPHAIDATVITE